MKLTLRRELPTSKNSTSTQVEASFTLDYPQENEEMTCTNYTLRVGAPENAETVEVSINQGPWLTCRRASGYWWYDWSGFKPGSYQARARMRTREERVVVTLPRHFRVRR